MTDQPARRRRRGDTLEAAILDAAWEELAEHGWSGLRMDAVAARAGTGKPSLYSRWPSKAHLVRAAAARAARTSHRPHEWPGDLRSDLRLCLKATAQALSGPLGEATRGLVAHAEEFAESPLDPPTQYSDTAPIQAVTEVLSAARYRGELSPNPPSIKAVNLGITLVTHHHLVNGAPPDDSTIEEILDVWCAALTAPHTAS